MHKFEVSTLGLEVQDTKMITIRFDVWISGGIVSLQPYTDIQKLLSNGNRLRIRYPNRFYRCFEDSDFWKKLHIAQSFIYYLHTWFHC